MPALFCKQGCSDARLVLGSVSDFADHHGTSLSYVHHSSSSSSSLRPVANRFQADGKDHSGAQFSSQRRAFDSVRHAIATHVCFALGTSTARQQSVKHRSHVRRPSNPTDYFVTRRLPAGCTLRLSTAASRRQRSVAAAMAAQEPDGSGRRVTRELLPGSIIMIDVTI